jgi:hypothetical protein
LLAYLRVYEMAEPISVVYKENGEFLALKEPKMLSKPLPVISDGNFHHRKQQMDNGELPEHLELEALQVEIAHLSHSCPKAAIFNANLQIFLGWRDLKPISTVPEWVQKISALGYRSDETPDNKLSNYHAGTDFEIVVRDSFTNLGFIVNESHQGGAGGIDAFCSMPYSLVIECKSGRSIPDHTVEQLERIAKRHLKENYRLATRLIIGPGKPTKNLAESADFSQVSIMKPESLQKLVELNHQHPNSVNPFELKEYLQPGEIDEQINQYIAKIRFSIQVRAHVIQAIKKLKEHGDVDVSPAEVRADYNARFGQNPDARLSLEQVQDILIELSSPLTGYLGRVEGTDRFYFLRELQID